jgi:small conductance mechanosensitive channel
MSLPDNFLQVTVIPILFRVLVAIIVLIIGRWLARKARSALTQSLAKTDLTESMVTLLTVLTYYSVLLLYYSVLLLGILMALAILGVPVTTLVAAVGVILIILGIAMQQSLGNLAATVIFLLFKPFEVGDIIETGGTMGIAREIQVFSTVILTLDYKLVTLPNAKIQGAGITNYSKMGILRADMTFSISYEDDIAKARQLLEELVAADERILAEPEPQIVLLELGESSVNIGVRPFVKTTDIIIVQSDIMEKAKKRFEEAGISIPYPQTDIHIRHSNGQSEVENVEA